MWRLSPAQPTVDHVADGLIPSDFVICSWRVNDAKNDLDRASSAK
jgi:hypothetical protein